MDISLLAAGIIISCVITILTILPKLDTVAGYLMAGISAMAGVLDIFLFVGLGSDGDLTSTSAGTVIPLSSATLNALTWSFVTLVPIVFGLFAFMAAVYRIYKGF